MRLRIILGLVAAALLAGGGFYFAGQGGGTIDVPARGYSDRAGTAFPPAPSDPYRTPDVTEIPIPDFPGSSAIWGSTGRDDRGHIWIGVSTRGPDHSAHLFEYDPRTGAISDRGGALENLKKAGILRSGERQVKIHSKIIQGDDGYLYFASMDEQGEDPGRDINPIWGSHLWRLRPEGGDWEHLFSAPEGLVAVAGTGRWIYALGYWGHILYQFDTRTERVKSTEIGSLTGHISRNLIADHQGHVYVPRLWTAEDGETVVVALLELNSDLEIIAATPLDHYSEGISPAASHGIIGFTYMADNSIVAATHQGYLYQIVPVGQGPSLIRELGWFHPSGTSYAPSIFSFEGRRYLVGQASAPRGRPEWVVFDLESRTSKAVEFPYGWRPLIYGTNTRDDAGGFYIVGRTEDGPRERPYTPLLLRLSVGP